MGFLAFLKKSGGGEGSRKEHSDGIARMRGEKEDVRDFRRGAVDQRVSCGEENRHRTTRVSQG